MRASLDKRLAALEQQQPGPMVAYVVYDDDPANDYVKVDGEYMPLDLFLLTYPYVDLGSVKSYGGTADWNPEGV